MSGSSKKKAVLISMASIALLVLSVTLYYYLKPGHDAIPVYKKLPENVFRPYFHAGQTRYFTKGALYCNSLNSIKQYYDHTNARNLPGVILSIVKGDCNYVSEDKVYVVLEEVIGMFAKVTPRGGSDATPRWMPVHELARE